MGIASGPRLQEEWLDPILCGLSESQCCNSEGCIPLPRIYDMLDTLSGSQWFTTLDLVSEYWQVEVLPEDREKTVFCTPEGLYIFNVMPFQ